MCGYLNLGAQLSLNPDLNGQSFNFGPKAEYNRTVKRLLEDLSVSWHFTDPKDSYKIVANLPFHEAELLKLNCDKALFYLRWTAALNYDKLLKFTGDWYYKYYKTKTDMYKYTIEQINEYFTIARQGGVEWAQ
jgi:CDP-glucose 4,6-dehydratase